jgi:pyruvate dehydrogenase complex dehydrogenase (E1) component
MMECNDGDYQSFKANDGAYVRKNFFGRDPRTLKMVEMSDDDIWRSTAAATTRRRSTRHSTPPMATRASPRWC